MARKKPAPVPVHDHFDGSAHCVQCGGECRLTGAELLLTEMIRWEFEIAARKGLEPFGMVRSTIAKTDVDIEAFVARAKATT